MALKREQSQEAGAGSTQIQAEGNINYQPTTIFNPPEPISGGAYQKLVDGYNKERESGDTTLNTIIDKIQKYSDVIDTEFIGLPKKLEDGGFESDIKTAMRLKEDYAKYLYQNNFSIAKQKIHGYLLAKIFVAFDLCVVEAIREKKSKLEIKDILLEKVIKPIEDELGIDNVLDLYRDDVLGMVYFLTGNCHISWK